MEWPLNNMNDEKRFQLLTEQFVPSEESVPFSDNTFLWKKYEVSIEMA